MLQACDPPMPPGAYNRVADNWRPLFAIAHVAGGDWPRRALEAFNHLTNRRAETDACHSLSASGAAGEASVKKNKVGQGDVARSSLSQSAICTLQSAIDTGEVARSSPAINPQLSTKNTQPLDGLAVELLATILQIFTESGATRLSSKQLVDALRALSEMRNPKSEIGGSALSTLQSAIDPGEVAPISNQSPVCTPHSALQSLARLLLPFGIRPRTMRIGNLRVKGYDLADFAEAFANFLKS